MKKFQYTKFSKSCRNSYFNLRPYDFDAFSNIHNFVNYLLPFKFSAFTLAEVLITLGVIGVVAAITMPVLTKHYQHKVLESQFKKTYAEISQLSNQFLVEFGNCGTENYDNMVNLAKTKYNTINTKNHTYHKEIKNYTRDNFIGTLHTNCLEYISWENPSVLNLNNGKVISFCQHSAHGNMITADTNGYNKGPNALGHDIFLMLFDKDTCKIKYISVSPITCQAGSEGCISPGNYKAATAACSKNSTADANGLSCFLYAMRNKCPDDSSKNYWECLP